MEGKKSFVLYSDLMDIVQDLNDEQAGKLIKLIVDYVNDRNPSTDDQIIKIAFTPIKNQLKRDLQKWQSIKEKRSEAGKLGGRPKKQTEAKKANGFFEKQTEAKKAVSVNVNDNVNNNRSFRADANKDVKEYRKYLFDLIKDKAISRDQLFAKCEIDLTRRNELWEAFILNSIENVPLIEDDKHGWNTFKKFINDNHKEWQVKAKSNFNGW